MIMMVTNKAKVRKQAVSENVKSIPKCTSVFNKKLPKQFLKGLVLLVPANDFHFKLVMFKN